MVLGRRFYGQQANGATSADIWTPARTDSPNLYLDVAAGATHILAIRDDNTLWSAGYNGAGALGIGTTMDADILTQVGSDTDWSQVFSGMGSFSSFGLKISGSLYAWGANTRGQLGIGTFTNRLNPTLVPSLTSVTQCSAGVFFSICLDNGRAFTAGNHAEGRTGQGTNTGFTEHFTEVGGPDFVSIGTFERGAYAVTNSSELFAWGQGTSGANGLPNNPLHYLVPNQVSGIGWVSCSGGEFVGLCLQNSSITNSPTASPTATPSAAPSKAPTGSPTARPTTSPTAAPSNAPTGVTNAPSTGQPNSPTKSPSSAPTSSTTVLPEMVGSMLVIVGDLSFSPKTTIALSSSVNATGVVTLMGDLLIVLDSKPTSTVVIPLVLESSMISGSFDSYNASLPGLLDSEAVEIEPVQTATSFGVSFSIDDSKCPTFQIWPVVGGVIGGVVLIALIIVIIYVIKKGKERKKIDDQLRGFQVEMDEQD